jgi:predicted MPP superfamily phosphohydrolase
MHQCSSSPLLATTLLLLLLLNATGEAFYSKPSLRFRSDGTFKIVQFTDLHYGEAEEKDTNSSIAQDKILAIEKPDLVVMTGDCGMSEQRRV